MTRVGMWYATGQADKPFDASDPAFNVHRCVSDEAEVYGCITVENGGGQRFAVPVALFDQVAAPVPVGGHDLIIPFEDVKEAT